MIEAVHEAVARSLAECEQEKDFCQKDVDRLRERLSDAESRLARHRKKIADLREFMSWPCVQGPSQGGDKFPAHVLVNSGLSSAAEPI